MLKSAAVYYPLHIWIADWLQKKTKPRRQDSPTSRVFEGDGEVMKTIRVDSIWRLASSIYRSAATLNQIPRFQSHWNCHRYSILLSLIVSELVVLRNLSSSSFFADFRCLDYLLLRFFRSVNGLVLILVCLFFLLCIGVYDCWIDVFGWSQKNENFVFVWKNG